MKQPPETGAPPPQLGAISPAEPSVVRAFLRSRGSSAMADGAFKALMLVCALSIFGIVGLIAFELI